MQLPQCRGGPTARPPAPYVARPSARAQLDNHKHNFGVQTTEPHKATSDPEAKCEDQKRTENRIESPIASESAKPFVFRSLVFVFQVSLKSHLVMTAQPQGKPHPVLYIFSLFIKPYLLDRLMTNDAHAPPSS